MSTYIISDIHGSNTNFRKALKAVKLKKIDTLILLGDLIDRGDESKEVLDTVLLLKEHGFNVICLLGNHEQMLIDSFNDFSTKVSWIRNGGDKTLMSFLTSDIKGIPSIYIELIESMKHYHIIDDYILVHAGLNMKIQNPFEDLKSILWLRDWQRLYDSNWLGKRFVFHGHTPMSEDEIRKQFKDEKKVICIDNGSFMKKDGFGSICILRLDDFDIKFVK